MTDNMIATLQHVPIFRNIPPQFLRRLTQAAIYRKFCAGDMLCTRGELSLTLFVLLKGQAIVVGVDDEGREVILNLLKPGELFGELAVIDGLPRSADVVALTDGEALLIRRADFLSLMERMPNLVWQLLLTLARRIRETDELVMRMAWLNAHERLAWALLEFADKNFALPNWFNISFLSRRCGLARETTSRIVSQWQKEGILSKSKTGFVILKPEKLQAMLKSKVTECV